MLLLMEAMEVEVTTAAAAVVAAMATPLPPMGPPLGGKPVVVFSTRPSVSGCLLRSLLHSPPGYDQNEPQPLLWATALS